MPPPRVMLHASERDAGGFLIAERLDFDIAFKSADAITRRSAAC
ncbi:unnamed protein product [Tuwongella immobilis]|uniref:Uncharacterized protein n=1 Tax=Tuwongella immobilis TaxID=692036 RepID=A0A6C2YQ74_9BACT|nr:unnamed protein product [Tuwongella immobilis]VTS04943.1 unnamed protein product [Tuwongella immobilis]